MTSQGFERIEAFSPSPSITLVLGQQPDAPDESIF